MIERQGHVQELPRSSRAGQFHRVATVAGIVDGASLGVDIDGRPVALVRCGGLVHAVDNLCPHAGGRLAQGRISENTIICPLHGAKFDLLTGRCRTPQICLRPVVVHAVRIVLSAEPISAPQL
jgi:nitrite reductase/ring-hydroxylating ferredoxin subunit